jgi:hypothetical protein
MQTYKISFARWATALLSIEAEDVYDAMDLAEEVMDDGGEIEEYFSIDLVHRYWLFVDEVDAEGIFLHTPKEYTSSDLDTFIVQVKRDGVAHFKITDEDEDSAIKRAKQLLRKNEILFPIESDFWTITPDFKVIKVAKIAAQ